MEHHSTKPSSSMANMANLARLARLAGFLAVLFLAFWLLLPYLPKSFFWPIFAALAAVWFAYEHKINKTDKGRVRKALTIGLLVVLANLFVNYVFGFVLGAYIIEPRYSLLFILGNPVELLIASFLGSAAWFLYVPKKFDKVYSFFDVLTLAFFGMVAERMLIDNSLLTYVTVDSLNAFLTYAALWAVVHFVYYKLLK